jgi:hypothetical protein
MPRRTINDVLADAQACPHRVTPKEAADRVREGWTLVDVRASDLRARDGRIPGAVHAPLNVLEWRVDPASGAQEPALAGKEDRLILFLSRGVLVQPRGRAPTRARLHEHDRRDRWIQRVGQGRTTH